jgi:Fe-S cluster assembly protein SufD
MSVPVAFIAAAQQRAAALGQPTRALEDWRYVDVKPLAQDVAAGTAPQVPANGIIFSGGTCQTGTLPTGCAVLAEQALACEVASITDPATLWAVTGTTSGLALGLTADVDLAVIIAGAGTMGWRLHLDVATGCRVRLFVEHHHAAAARTCGWITLALGAGTHVEAVDTDAGDQDQRLVTWQVAVGRDATFRHTAHSIGGRLCRSRIEVTLAAPGASCDLAAIDATAGDHQAHRLTRVLHAAPHTTSRQLLKAIVNDRSAISCDGLITMVRGADGSDANLQNRNLLLSEHARADTRPQLDIRADEVKAAHGATVGRLPVEELLYLRLRGLDESAARALLGESFANEVLMRITGLKP